MGQRNRKQLGLLVWSLLSVHASYNNDKWKGKVTKKVTLF